MEVSAAPLRHLITTLPTGDSHLSLLHHHNKPMKVAVPQNQQYWASISADIESHLKQAIQIRPPFSVYEPMHYLVFSTPTTMAPPLSVAACELVGGQPEKAIPVASALHLMNAASLVHQRLPLSDRPMGPTSRGHHHSFPAGIELLTGDGILSFGYELLARTSGEPERILSVISEIARAMGAQGMVKGQYLQMRCSGSASDGDHTDDGLLYACGAACGAILGGATKEETERLRRFGRYLGMIQGLISVKSTAGDDDDGGQEEEVVERLRSLALEELECFNHQPMVEIISSIIHC